jgi:hypothetical protein
MLKAMLALGSVVVIIAVAAGSYLAFASRMPVPPRILAPVIEQRAAGHNATIVATGTRLRSLVEGLDARMEGTIDLAQFRVGAQPERTHPRHTAIARREVSGTEQLRRALETAQPGDDIVLLPGTYSIASTMEMRRSGLPDRRITVRAERLNDARLEINATEGFLVAAPYWTFRNLHIRGTCAQDEHCEHAFHVTGAASHFELANSVVEDFNAHLKINGIDGRFPDHGLIENNILRNRTGRQTSKPVTLVDLVAASEWRVQGNIIANFIKAGGDGVSYGLFAKGAGEGNRFERNIILCETGAASSTGQRVGMSFGGGGTAAKYCRDGRCLMEQENSSMVANLIARCSDVGIYVNRAAGIRIQHNTLLDTAGVQVRHPESAAYLSGNLIDGPVASRDDGIIHAADNIDTGMVMLYTGRHPVRELFNNAGTMDLAWREKPRGSAAENIPDLCGTSPGSRRIFGAFNDFAACRK